MKLTKLGVTLSQSFVPLTSVASTAIPTISAETSCVYSGFEVHIKSCNHRIH